MQFYNVKFVGLYSIKTSSTTGKKHMNYGHSLRGENVVCIGVLVENNFIFYT